MYKFNALSTIRVNFDHWQTELSRLDNVLHNSSINKYPFGDTVNLGYNEPCFKRNSAYKERLLRDVSTYLLPLWFMVNSV